MREYPNLYADLAAPGNPSGGTRVQTALHVVLPMPDPLLPAPIENPSPVLDPDARRVDTAQQLPPHRGKVGRVTDHLAAISADAREWVELQIELIRNEVTEKVDMVTAKVNQVAEVGKVIEAGGLFFPIAGFVGLYAFGFLLATVAVGIGWAFASEGATVLRPLFWGLLILTFLLLLIVGVSILIGMRRVDKSRAIEASLKMPDVSESDQMTPLPNTRHQLQDLERDHARQMAS